MNKIKAAVFDLDGTLLNTLEDLADSCNQAMKSFGFKEHSIEEVRMFVGNGLAVLAQKAIPDGKENPRYKDVLAFLRSAYAKNANNKTKPYDGITELLQKLDSSGIKCAVVSNKPDAQVKELCALYFKDVIDKEVAVGEMEAKGIRRKPYPDSVLAVMKKLNVTKEETLYIGDSDVDIETAKAAGIPCASVTWGFRSRDFLIRHGAKILCDFPQDLLKKIVEF